jgi:hypothetical protein
MAATAGIADRKDKLQGLSPNTSIPRWVPPPADRTIIGAGFQAAKWYSALETKVAAATLSLENVVFLQSRKRF